MEILEDEQPFRKRPRLSMFPSDDQLDDDLGGRRRHNDLLLKSRFESIFEKYSHDFSGIGDEIEMDTLTVVVNNGHLQLMENETDPGGLHNTKGQRLLRAMTEALGDEKDEFYTAGADKVMDSIEEMAESAAVAEGQEDVAPLDSDEELFLPVHARASYLTPPDSRESHATPDSGLVDSGLDSLFETHRPERSDTPDSLFEVQPSQAATSDYAESLIHHEEPEDGVGSDAILQKFGPQVGKEVLRIIQRAKHVASQAHIEPAWRIPDDIIPPEQRPTTSRSKTPPSSISMPAETQDITSPEHASSLWKPARFRSTKRATHQARVMKRIRAESEDPLQEDFAASADQAEATYEDSDASDWGKEHRPKKTKKTNYSKQARVEPNVNSVTAWDERPRKPKKHADADDQVLQMRKGTCFYCLQQWNNRASVFKHWVKLAKQFKWGEIVDDDVHDLDYVQAYVASSHRAARGPRLIVSDFKTLVELHEGAGISFNEIAELRALRTQKTGFALNDVYDRYRDISDRLGINSVEWTEEEIQMLHELSQDPKRDMGTFAAHFQGRSNTDVGDKLAEIWLGDLIDSNQLFARAVHQEATTSAEVDHKTPQQQCRESSVDQLVIKQEPCLTQDPFVERAAESDDELFG